MADEFIFREHPVSACLSAETAVMNEEDEVGAFPVSSFAHLQVVLIGRASSDIPVQT